jgi:hypothetical protein
LREGRGAEILGNLLLSAAAAGKVDIANRVRPIGGYAVEVVSFPESTL